MHPVECLLQANPTNLTSATIKLDADTLKAIDSELDKINIHGNRTDEDIMKMGTTREVQTLHEKGLWVSGENTK